LEGKLRLLFLSFSQMASINFMLQDCQGSSEVAAALPVFPLEVTQAYAHFDHCGNTVLNIVLGYCVSVLKR